MATVAARRTAHQNVSHRTNHQKGSRRTAHQRDFDAVAEPFLRGEGLPFSEVLAADSIQRVFREEDALFGQDDIFSTPIVLWAFLAQALCDGKGAACSAAVGEITTFMLQTDQTAPILSPDSMKLPQPRLTPLSRPR